MVLSSGKNPDSHRVRSDLLCDFCQDLSEKASVMTCPYTEAHTGRPHYTQSHIYTKLNTKAPKPQQPVLQPKPKLNLIPAGTSIRAVEDKVGHRRQTGFTSKVSILRLQTVETTLAFRSESVSRY